MAARLCPMAAPTKGGNPPAFSVRVPKGSRGSCGGPRTRTATRVPAAIRLPLVDASVTLGAAAFEAKTVKQGDVIPDVPLSYFDSDGNIVEVSTRELCSGKRVVLFAVPGAFTPTCSTRHLPGFVENAPLMRERGVDEVACVSVNDAFVMDAWGKSVGTDGQVLMLADGSAKLARALGVELDLTEKGLGLRSRRYAMLIDDNVITKLNLEEGGAFTKSSADDILNAL